MDALRRAEQQKQQGSGTGGGGAPTAREGDGLTLEPLPDQKKTANTNSAATPPGNRLPELPKRLEELDEQFFTIPPAAGKNSSTRGAVPPRSAIGDKAATDTARASAQNVFAAKQPVAPVGRGFAIGVGVATLVAVVAIGAYFYWQLQPKGGLTVAPALTPPSSSPMAPPLPERAAATPLPPPTSSTPVTSPTPALATSTPAKPQETPAAAMPSTSPSDQLSAASAAPPSSERPRQADTAAAPSAASDITLRPSKQPTRSDDAPEAAYTAFMRGEYDRARNLWLKILRNDTRNLDALLGLAALAQQEGKPELAERFFRKAIEVDPKNPAANAGLLALNPPADPRLAESRLKGLLTEQPDSPQLHFALGNLYSGESRWAEAQQAYFKAHVADPSNADILYNLAVSLDHLHQERLAAQYYARALAAARSGPASFDSAQAETRLQALQAAQDR